MNDLVTLDEAKAHIRVLHDAEDDVITDYIAAAQAIVIARIRQRRDPTEQAAWIATMEAWDEDTVPADIKQAIYIQCGDLEIWRGGDEKMPSRELGRLSPLVEAILTPYREVTVA